MRSFRMLFRQGPPLLAVLAALTSPARVLAAWAPLGGPGVTVCDAPASPGGPASAPDGQGGVFIAWNDGRAGFPAPRVFVQHVDAAGTPRWIEDGLLVNSSHSPEQPRLASDGAGGVIVVWRDFRADTAGNLYAQRLNGSGVKLWDPAGVALALGPLHENHVSLAPDGSGGAFVSWSDDRTGPADIRVQRLTSAGSLDWGADGVAMASPTVFSTPLQSVVRADGMGGALVGYTTTVAGDLHAFVQRFSSDGLPLWTSGGVQASSSSLWVICADMAADGTGGALVALADYRTQNTWNQAYAQRIHANGSVAWASDGVPMSGAALPIQEQAVVADGTGGGLFAWRSYLNDGSGVSHLIVQRLDASGTAAWAPATRLVAAPDDGGNGWLRFQMVSDGNGGAVLGWNAYGVAPGFDVSAQRIAGDGTMLWTPGPRALASLPNIVHQLALVPDGTGGVVASWLDTHGFSSSPTIAAERVLGTGTLDVPPPVSTLRGVHCSPTPARTGDAITVRFVLPEPGPVHVRVLDITGRLVRTLPPPAPSAGEHTLVWDARDAKGQRVRPGLYLVQVEARGLESTGRVLVVE